MRLRLILAEAVRSIGSSASTTAAATVTVLIAMFVFGLSIALGSWMVSWSNHVKSGIQVKVFFNENAQGSQVEAVRRHLDGNRRIKSLRFIPEAEALRIMQKKFPELTENLPSNPLPASFEIVPLKGEYAKEIKASLTPHPPGVSEVKDGGETARRIIRVGRIIELIFLVAVLVLVAASTLLIANTIRLSIFARRREIEVMKLVGATNWFVRGPFMLEGVLCGLAGSLVAVLLLLMTKELALPAILPGINDDQQVQAWGFGWIALALFGAGLALGAAGSGLTLRRFLKV